MRYRKSCVTGLEASSDASRVVGTGWSIDSCKGGKSADSVCDGSGNAATTIDSGLSEAAVVSVAVPAAGSAAVATSALATTALPIAIACGSSARLPLAMRDARRSSIGAAATGTAALACLMRVEPNPASEAMTQPARPTVPHKANATCALRRGFIIRSPPPEPRCTAKHATAMNLRINCGRAMTQIAAYRFFREVSPECNAMAHCSLAKNDQLREP